MIFSQHDEKQIMKRMTCHEPFYLPGGATELRRRAAVIRIGRSDTAQQDDLIICVLAHIAEVRRQCMACWINITGTGHPVVILEAYIAVSVSAVYKKALSD